MNFKKIASISALSFIMILLYTEESYCKCAGILLYKIQDGITYFLVGCNAKLISDLGDAFDAKKDSDLFFTAARGFNEKTMFRLSAEGLDGFDIAQLYRQGDLPMQYHNAIKKILEQPTTLKLYFSNPQGYKYTLFIVPMNKVPFPEASQEFGELDERPITLVQELQSIMLAVRKADHKWRSEVQDFAWLNKDNLYDALNRTAPGAPVSVIAPTYRDLDRQFSLSPNFSSVLRDGIKVDTMQITNLNKARIDPIGLHRAKTNRRGIQSVMP